ncbi:MPN207a family PTS transporter accessory protein [Mycoplasma sp. E35C]|uniref:MPN207a family PTS transporter accessory protein n=1 Tax=Mycoplasma sp. E35C TaxID=2801918 RepID=UPI001CA46479|nr:hypothetical protein [Mycoplasma sp. E35C]QZX49249.1 hypothetical protein JJE79_00575 [Mycoplasma sp. E35C]
MEWTLKMQVYLGASIACVVICLILWGLSIYLFIKRKKLMSNAPSIGFSGAKNTVNLTWWEKNGGYLMFVLGIIFFMFAVYGFTEIAGMK